MPSRPSPRGKEEEEEEEEEGGEGGDGATTTTAGTTASARRRRGGAKAATPTARGDRDAPRSVPSRASSSAAPKPRTLAVAVAFVAFATAAALLLLPAPPAGPGRDRAASDLPGASGPGAVVRADHGPDDVVSSSASSPSSRIGDFFDCDFPGSSCRYLRPGEFHRNYYHRLHDEQYDDHGEEEEGYRIWRKHIGLDNANLPSLDTLSWWAATYADVAQDGGGGYSPSVVPPPPPTVDVAHDLMPPPRRVGNVTYVHVHKCGGTSIQSAMYSRARAVRATATSAGLSYRAEVRTYKHSFGGGTRARKEVRDRERSDHVRRIADAQSSQSSSHPIFTVLRDPIERFLSAIQQVMHYNDEYRARCLFEDDRREEEEDVEGSRGQISSYLALLFAGYLRRGDDEREQRRLRRRRREEEEEEEEEEMRGRQRLLRMRTIRCAIDDAEETNYRNDVHLLPMSSHFRLLDGYHRAGGDDDNATTTANSTATRKTHGDEGEGLGVVAGGGGGRDDIAISVFAMEDISDVIAHLLVSRSGGETADDDGHPTAGRRGRGYYSPAAPPSTIFHARDRSDVRYATSPILAALSVDDCDEDMIRRICDLYHIDVELMRWLGFGGVAVERCAREMRGGR
jgi:hypothetical protein